MLLSEYVSEIVEILDTYAKANLIADSDVHTDFRTEKIGLVKGSITFINNSKNILMSGIRLKNFHIPIIIRTKMDICCSDTTMPNISRT